MDNQNKDVFQRLMKGETISPGDSEAHRLLEESYHTKKLLFKLNAADNPDDIRKYLGLIVGEELIGVDVFTPLYINYGKNIKIGKNVFINFDCVFLGLGGITIEDDVLIAPKVSLLSEGHPVDPAQRHSLVPCHIYIKKGAWIGANATILKGVTVGENSIVASGAVVSKDVPDNCIVGGIPAKVIRESLY